MFDYRRWKLSMKHSYETFYADDLLTLNAVQLRAMLAQFKTIQEGVHSVLMGDIRVSRGRKKFHVYSMKWGWPIEIYTLDEKDLEGFQMRVAELEEPDEEKVE